MKRKEGEPVQDHIGNMIEVFEELAVIGDPLEEEDQVVFLLASLPESFDILVTALEVNADVPKMDVVRERLLHEEHKQERGEDGQDQSKALASFSHDKVKCYNCGKPGHIKGYCTQLNGEGKRHRFLSRKKGGGQRANKVAMQDLNSDSENDLYVISHGCTFYALGTGGSNWIIDSGATCHMCNIKETFAELHSVGQSMKVAVGDGCKMYNCTISTKCASACRWVGNNIEPSCSCFYFLNLLLLNAFSTVPPTA